MSVREASPSQRRPHVERRFRGGAASSRTRRRTTQTNDDEAVDAEEDGAADNGAWPCPLSTTEKAEEEEEEEEERTRTSREHLLLRLGKERTASNRHRPALINRTHGSANDRCSPSRRSDAEKARQRWAGRQGNEG